MAKTSLTFVCEEHEEYGGNGWRPEKHRDFDPLTGMAVAHDIMEHFPNGDESTAHELMAFGASMFVRKDYYSHKQNGVNRPSDNFAGEIGDMLRKIQYGQVGSIGHCPYRRNVRGNDYVNSEINHAVSELRKWLASETDGEMELSAADALNIRGWLAEGYRRAVKRYSGIDCYLVQSTFEEIERQADEALKHAEHEDRLVVKVWKRRHPGWAELAFDVQHVPGYELDGDQY